MESIQQGPHLVFYFIVVLNPITVFCNKIQKRKTIIALKKQNDSNYSLLVKHTPLGEKSVELGPRGTQFFLRSVQEIQTTIRA